MLKINPETRYVEGSRSEIYENKDHLKFYRCLWDKETKQWRIPYEQQHLDRLEAFVVEWNKMQEEKDNKKRELWQQALDNLRLRFAARGTPEYELVKQEFKRLIKQNN